jgi:hypothetical protein
MSTLGRHFYLEVKPVGPDCQRAGQAWNRTVERHDALIADAEPVNAPAWHRGNAGTA